MQYANLTEQEIRILVEAVVDRQIKINEGLFDAIAGGFKKVGSDAKDAVGKVANAGKAAGQLVKQGVQSVAQGAQNVGGNIKRYGQEVAAAGREASMKADADKAYQDYLKKKNELADAKARYQGFIEQGYKSTTDRRKPSVTRTGSVPSGVGASKVA